MCHWRRTSRLIWHPLITTWLSSLILIHFSQSGPLEVRKHVELLFANLVEVAIVNIQDF